MKDRVIGMAHALTYDGEGLPEERDVSPPKTNDASKLNLPIAWSVGVALFFVTVAGSLGAVASNVRDINTRMEMQAKIDEANQKLDDERMAGIKADLEDIQRNMKLAQYELQQFKDSLSRGK